jgi:hypothetical protein
MSVTLKNTKNQIFNAYKELVSELKKLEKEHKAKETEAGKLAKELEACKDAQGEPQIIVKAPAVNTLEGVIASLKSIEIGIASSFSETSALQVVEAEKLEDLREKIEEEHAQIQELYDVELDKDTMSSIIEEYLASQEEFEAHFKTKKNEYEEALETEEESWKNEKEQHRLEIEDRDREADLEKERDEELYTYQLEQERKLEDDNYAQKSKNLNLELKSLEDAKEEEWKEREKEVAEREEEFEKYKTDYEGLKEKLDKELKRAEGEAKGIIERDHKVKMRMLKTEAEGEQEAMDLKINDLKSVIEKQNMQIQKLYQQLEETQRQAQTLAIKALEGNSTSESFKAVREIAIEQAKHLGKGK